MTETPGGPRDRSDRELIKLDQFLKLQGWVETGGQAKIHIKAGEVRVNGEVETRRGRRLRPGDVIEAFGQALQIAHGSATARSWPRSRGCSG